MTKREALNGKPYAGNPHVRFDEGEAASTATSRRGSLLYKISIRQSIDKIKTFSRTFIERPRFAMVISIVLSLAGVMAICELPVSQYPRLTPPSIQVVYTYPGASAQEIWGWTLRNV